MLLLHMRWRHCGLLLLLLVSGCLCFDIAGLPAWQLASCWGEAAPECFQVREAA
jgi:hypothetical protein